jgi:probable HAF family extracellular repeat protein
MANGIRPLCLFLNSGAPSVQWLEQVMKHFGTVSVALTTLVAASIPSAPAIADARPGASQTASRAGSVPRYRLIDLGTFGGPNSAETVEFPYVSNRGTVVGFADTAVPSDGEEGFIFHAFRWRGGVLTDLGAPADGRNSFATVVNDHDVVVGLAENQAGEGVAVKWTSAGRIVPLGSFGGRFGLATDINERGQIVGAAADTTPAPGGWFDFPTRSRPFLWDNGVMRNLGTLGGLDAGAFFINEQGHVAGNSTISAPSPGTGDADIHPFLWRNGKMIDLGSFGGHNTFANGLNNRDQVVGDSFLPGDQAAHPFLWSKGRLHDLGTLGGLSGNASAVNDAGEVTGAADTADNVTHAYLWTNGVTTDLGTVAGDTCSQARAINATGQVVGTSGHCEIEGGMSQHGFLWQRDAGLIDLNAYVPPGNAMTMMDAETINDHGEIAGTGKLANGNYHAVVLIPCHDNRSGCQSAATVGRFQETPSR